MIDEKKLIEDLIPLLNENGDMFLAGKIIGTIDIQPQVGGWTPVSEGMPDKTGNYLVASKDCTWVANWFNGTWWGIEKRCIWTGIEAWMPLPEPYKAGEE